MKNYAAVYYRYFNLLYELCETRGGAHRFLRVHSDNLELSAMFIWDIKTQSIVWISDLIERREAEEMIRRLKTFDTKTFDLNDKV